MNDVADNFPLHLVVGATEAVAPSARALAYLEVYNRLPLARPFAIPQYSAAAIQQAAHVEQAQPPTRVGAALFNRPAQPQMNNAPIADAGNTGAPAQENVASQQAVQHPNAYVQSVLYTYGPSAQLSDAPGLQLNPGGVASMQSRIMPAHINLASHIADNIGAGPTQIDPLARTIAQLSRQEFGDGVVRDLIAEAESIGRQPLAPIDKFASFSRTLQTFIEKHLPNRANARSDDPQIRDARNAKGEKRGSP